MEMQKKLKAALYIRVSTEEQAIDGQSASAQAETLKQYCFAFGIEIFDIYMDMGISGKSFKDRNELMRLIDDCSNSLFNMVLVWKISRLSRNLKDLLYLIDIFEKHNVHFTSCSEKFDTSTPVGRMTLQLLGSIAEFERNTIVENVKLGLDEFARKGGKASSVLGYDNIEKRLIVNESEAKIVKLIFSLYTEAGLSFSAIAKYLNSLGYRTKRGSEFRGSSISYAIRNPVYIGINRHRMNTKNEYSIRNAHQAIISTEQWNKAHSIIPDLRKRRVKNSCHSDPSPFRVACMKCNSPMTIFYAHSKGKKYKYMRCVSCSNYVNVERLMKTVAEVFLTIIDDNAKQKAAYNLINQTHTAYEHKSMEIASIDSEINRLKRSRTRYLRLFEDYKISDNIVFINRISEMEHQLDLLEKKKLALGKAVLSPNEHVDYEEYFKYLKKRLSSLEPVVLKQLSECLIKSIEAYKNEIKIVLYL